MLWFRKQAVSAVPPLVPQATNGTLRADRHRAAAPLASVDAGSTATQYSKNGIGSESLKLDPDAAGATHGRLVAQGVGFRAGQRWLLQGVNLQACAGRVLALLGPNGAGKTTLLSLLSGQAVPTAGEVCLHDRAVRRWPTAQLARWRAVMPQQSAVAFEFAVEEIVGLGRYPHRLNPSAREASIVPKAMAAAQVAHLAQQPYAQLSGGEKARVQLARVLAQLWEVPQDAQPNPQARWLMLDEPTAALDWAHQLQLMATVREWAHGQGVGVIAILHDLNLALRYADDVAVLQHGQLVAQGPVNEVLTEALIEQVWGVPAQRVMHSDGVARLIA